MTTDKEYALIGYIAGTAVLALFFWFTLGDAYGRFLIVFDPGQSMASGYLVYYTKGATGLVCLAAPLLLAYLPRYVLGRWAEALWDFSARAGLWILANGKRLTIFLWRRMSGLAVTLQDTVSRKINDHRK
jgi:hypothetical protein